MSLFFCDVLLVTVTDLETDTALAALRYHTKKKPREHFGENHYYEFEEMGGNRIGLVQSEMGSSTPGGSMVTLMHALREASFDHVIMFGIAFGIDEVEQQIGTVLVSKQIQCYDFQRQGLQVISRGEKVAGDTKLLKRFRAGYRRCHGFKMIAGLILSGSQLIDNIQYRDALLRQYPEAKGGEMEGAGLIAALERKPWIMVKAICDFADGNKARNKEHNQMLAAANAVQLVLASLMVGPLRQGGVRTDSIDDPSTIRPQPTYESNESQALAERLELLRSERANLLKVEADTSKIDREILSIRRELRDQGASAGVVLNERFELIEEVGTGGFAEVWKAWDRKREQLVAVKILLQKLSKDRTRRERFFRGAKRMAALNHSAVPPIIVEKAYDRPFYYFVMAYLSGGDLNRYVINHGSLTLNETWAILGRIGSALEEGHQRGWVHRDVKPGNILLNKHGQPFITDFDLIHAADTTGGTRTAGLGTFIYAAPEQNLDAQRVTPAADVYSLAMTAIFCLYGKKLPMTMMRHPESVVETLTASDSVKRSLLRGLSWDLEERYRSIQELLEGPERERSRPVGIRKEFELFNGIRITMRWIAPGWFLMGSPSDEPERNDDEIQHAVGLTRGFWLAETAVTQVLWQVVMKNSPSPSNGKNCPVENVSWDDVQEFLEKLNTLSSYEFRLPTEAEWEFACRANTNGPFHFGQNISTDKVNFNGGYPYNGGVKGQNRGEAVEVDALSNNSWGLLQMHGNVREWCEDWYGPYANEPIFDPTGPKKGKYRVARGGNWFSSGRWCRSAARGCYLPSFRYSGLGFRLAAWILSP